MKPTQHGRAIITELMIIILFFSLSSVVIVRLFEAAHHISRQSIASTKLLLTAQSWADQLQAEDDYIAFLMDNGWVSEEDALLLAVDDGTLKISGFNEEDGFSSRLLSCNVSAIIDEKVVITFPIASYKAGVEP